MIRHYGKIRNKDIWIWVVAGIALLSFLFTMIGHQTQKKPGTYQDQDQISQVSTTKAKEVQIDTYKYANKKLGFTIEIPRTWDQLTKSGHTTFMDKNTGATLEIEIDKYDPSINNLDQSNASTTIPDGMVFEGFQRDKGSSHYELRYQDMSGSSPYDYLEETYWDRGHIIKLLCIFKDSYYKDLTSYYTTIINSFHWNQPDPIPSGYQLVYLDNDSYSFEFGMPSASTWSVAMQNGVIAAQDSKTGMSMTISAMSNSASIANLTGSDAASLISNGRNQYIMQSIQSKADYTEVTGMFTNGNTQWTNQSFFYSDGYYWYLISFDYDKNGDTEIPTTCASLFRSYFPQKAKEYKKQQAKLKKQQDAQQKKEKSKKSSKKAKSSKKTTTTKIDPAKYSTHKSHNQIGKAVN